jgi:hypothetical protein
MFACFPSISKPAGSMGMQNIQVAMDLKSQKSPRSNRSTPFASPKVQPRPRNTPASPISTPRTPSAACVHPNKSQREGSCFEMDVSDSTPVQLTTKPLKRTSTVVATSLVPKNVSGHSSRCWVAGNAPISYSRSIRSSLMDSPTNSPSGPDAPGVFVFRNYLCCLAFFCCVCIHIPVPMTQSNPSSSGRRAVGMPRTRESGSW